MFRVEVDQEDFINKKLWKCNHDGLEGKQNEGPYCNYWWRRNRCICS